MLSPAHATTISIIRHWLGAVVSLTDREGLGTACARRILTFPIPKWVAGTEIPHPPAPAARIEYPGGECAIVVWADGARSLVPVPAGDTAYVLKPDAPRALAGISWSDQRAEVVEVAAATKWRPVEVARDHALYAALPWRIRAEARLRNGPARLWQRHQWIDPDARAWDRWTVRVDKEQLIAAHNAIEAQKRDDGDADDNATPALTVLGRRLFESSRTAARKAIAEATAGWKPETAPARG